MEFVIIGLSLLLAVAYFIYGLYESRTLRKKIGRIMRNYHHGRVSNLVSGNHDAATDLIRAEMQSNSDLNYADAAKQVYERLKMAKELR